MSDMMGGFDPRAAALLGGRDDMMPSKQEQRRMAAINTAINLTCAEHSNVRLTPDPTKAGTELVGIAKAVEKYLDHG